MALVKNCPSNVVQASVALKMFALLLFTCIFVCILFDTTGHTESDHICDHSYQQQKPHLHQHQSSSPLQSTGSTLTLQLTLGVEVSHMTWTFDDFRLNLDFDICDLSIMTQK